jgi:hypothetical protein
MGHWIGYDWMEHGIGWVNWIDMVLDRMLLNGTVGEDMVLDGILLNGTWNRMGQLVRIWC